MAKRPVNVAGVGRGRAANAAVKPRTKAAPGTKHGPRKLVASNKKARHDFDILDTLEAGIALHGSEVKPLRDAKVQMRDAYARLERGEMLLVGVTISPYAFAHGFGAHDPDRARRLLLHRRQIDDLAQRMAREQLQVIPLSIYFTDGRAKVELGLAKGRKTQDRRSALAERDANLDIARAMADSRRGRHERHERDAGRGRGRGA